MAVGLPLAVLPAQFMSLTNHQCLNSKKLPVKAPTHQMKSVSTIARLVKNNDR